MIELIDSHCHLNFDYAPKDEAALLAARRAKRMVTMAEFEDAKDKVMMGAERRTLVMTEDEKRLTAYHESGHAIVAFHVPATDPVHGEDGPLVRLWRS